MARQVALEGKDGWELADLKLSVPASVRRLMKSKEVTKLPHKKWLYVHFMTRIKGKNCMRTFVYLNWHGHLLFGEVQRRFQNGPGMICNLKYCYMAGWQLERSDLYTPLNYYDFHKQTWISENVEQCYKDGTAKFNGYYVNDEEFINKYYPHCGWLEYKADPNTAEMLLTDYLQIYEECPHVAWLAKNGYGTMVKSWRLFNFKGKTFSQIFKCDKKFEEYLKGKPNNYLLACRKNADYDAKDIEIAVNINNIRSSTKNTVQYLKKYYPYCAWDIYCAYVNDGISLGKYLKLYEKYPEMEMLVKCGYGHMITSLEEFNFHGKSWTQIFGCDKKWMEFLKGKDIRYLYAVRHTAVKTENDAKYFVLISYTLDGLTEREIRYVLDQKVDGAMYEDYISNARRLGYPLDQKEYKYPENLVVAHDALVKEVKILKYKRFDLGIKRTAMRMKKYAWDKGNMMILPAQSSKELIEESRVLSHCVRTYAERMSKGESAIFFIRLKDAPTTPYVTLELIDKKINQVHGYKNDAVFPLSPEVKNFVMEWKSRNRFSGWTATFGPLHQQAG